jgi:GT2 family glycosyltransferase
MTGEGVDVQPHGRHSKTERVVVSVVVPCRNEVHNIEQTLRSILAQIEPQGGFEVIVVDGMSNDGTRPILELLCHDNSNLRVVDNHALTTPAAMNTGIRLAAGEYIVIMGAHASYAPDYLVACLAMMNDHAEADCVGGPIKSDGKSLFGRAVALAMSHPFGVGNARHRFPDYEGYAEGACFPLFRKSVFEKLGLFDEALVRNQDDEFNFRLTKSGGRIFISPKAMSTYFVRETPGALFRQYYQYGLWRVAVVRNHQRPSSMRQLVPAAFLLVAVALGALGMIMGGAWWLLAAVLPSLYVAMLAGGAVSAGAKGDFLAAMLFPVPAMMMHLAYALGFVAGVVRIPFTRKPGSRVPLLGAP